MTAYLIEILQCGHKNRHTALGMSQSIDQSI